MSAFWALAALAVWSAAAPAPRSVLMIGWDGCDRRHVDYLLKQGKLPNLAALVKDGSFAQTTITTGDTETKPGWAEILTGLSADEMGIESNLVYRPIPKGATIFEKARAAYGAGICTAMIVGKGYNLGVRGPHEICANCWPREPKLGWAETYWWDRARSVAHTPNGLPARWVKREGEPFHNAAASIDVLKEELGSADQVGPAAEAALSECAAKPFFVFVHFEDPDEAGHRYTTGDARYDEAIEAADAWLGRLRGRLRSLGVAKRATVIVTTDHGFGEQSRFHHAEAHTWLASSLRGLRAKGDRKDAGATALYELGLDTAAVLGVPLQKP